MGLAMAELQVNRRYIEPSKLAFPCVIAGTMAAAAGTIKANAMGQQSKPVMTSALARAMHSISLQRSLSGGNSNRSPPFDQQSYRRGTFFRRRYPNQPRGMNWR